MSLLIHILRFVLNKTQKLFFLKAGNLSAGVNWVKILQHISIPHWQHKENDSETYKLLCDHKTVF